MNKSESIAQLSQALAKAQAVMEGASKDATNPHYRSKYADLASVWDACRGPLSSNGLSVAQFPSCEGSRVTLTTVLMHASGQYLEGELSATAKDDGPQSIGSVITYLRRYGLSAVAGVAPEDDDAEQAEGRVAGRGGVADPPAEVLDVTTGAHVPASERPTPPDGYRYIDAYRIENGWHHVTFNGVAGNGGGLTAKTKIETLGRVASEAFREGIPVQVETKADDKGALWLNKISTYKPALAPKPAPAAGETSF